LSHQNNQKNKFSKAAANALTHQQDYVDTQNFLWKFQPLFVEKKEKVLEKVL
jgi:hypothetical protein